MYGEYLNPIKGKGMMIMSESKFEIWKDGHLYLKVEDKKEANRIYNLIRETFKPRVIKLYELVTVTKLRRDNDKIYE